MINNIKSLRFTICIVILLGCNAEQPHDQMAKSHNHHSSNQSSYQKPGANIRLSHNYDGRSALGETETIELTFAEQYSSGQMYLRLKPDSSLSIQPSIKDFVFSMEDEEIHSIKLSVSSQSQGKHLLNIFASVIDESGKPQNRIMAVAFYVGDTDHIKSKQGAPTSSDRVIILPSFESGS